MSDKAIVPPNGRGCGSRTGGSVYAECGLSPFGKPIELFLVDPPKCVDEHALGLSNVGVKLIEIKGVYHVFDIVGEEYYPNVADMVEEMRRFGMSRKCELASADEYAKLTDRSTYVLLHRRAWIGNCEPYYRSHVLVNTYNPCPKNHPSHIQMKDDPDNCKDFEPCLGLCWNDVDGLELDQAPGEDGAVITDTRLGTRTMPSFTYKAANSPIISPKDYALAIFAILPITRIVLIRSGDTKTMDKKRARLTKCELTVEEEDQ